MRLIEILDVGGSTGGGFAPRQPAAWVVSDDTRLRGMTRSVVEAAGFSVEAAVSTREALDRIGNRSSDTLIFMEIGAQFDDEHMVFLQHLDAQGFDARRPTVVSFPKEVLDQVVSCVAAPHLILLCEPSNAERIAAIEMARADPGNAVFAGDQVTEAMKLQRLADEVARIARALAGLADSDAEPRVEAVSDGLIGYRAETPRVVAAAGSAVPVKADDVRSMIRLRRQREAMFIGDVFADPAWDMMLDLMAARIERIKVAVSSLCIAAAVPPTTALRWIRTLTDMGIFVRVADPNDRRRVFIELSEAASALVLNFLGEAKQAGVAVV